MALREQVALMFSRRGVPATADNVLITTGSQQGLDMVGRTLIDPGDRIVCESPTYIGALQAWRPIKPQFDGVAMDENGMLIDQVDTTRPLKLLYVLPNFQNPSGVSLSLERRRKAVEMAHRHGFIIVEDDPYRSLRYSGEELPSLLEIEAGMLGADWNANSRIIYLGTFSKVMAPGLRVGWMLAPTTALRMFVLAKQGADLHSSTLNQYIAEALLRNGTIEGNIPFLVGVYRERRDTMIDALQTYIGKRGTWTYPEGGLFIWLRVYGANAQALMAEALKHNVAFVPGDAFFPDGSGTDTMRLNFSCMPPDKIREGIRRLGELIAEMQPAAPISGD
jgi:2-aminoadipate transaminase